MKKNFWIPLIVAIALGFVSAQIVYSTYRDNLSSSNYNAYLLQIASFENFDSINSDMKDNADYLIINENNVYNVYVGITTNLDNANKIKNIYEKKDMEIYIKPTIINNIEFVSNLEQYDLLISEVDNEENLISISDVVLSSYEEIVLGN